MLVAGAWLTSAAGCQSTPDLPPTRVSTAHFRYHARSEGDVQSDVLARMERNRADFSQLMGLTDDDVTDYYYFSDPNDLATNGPCTLAGSDCVVGRSAYASVPFHEHELIHTYMASVGAPSAPLLEGVAESVGCVRSASAASSASEQDWRRAVHEYPSPDPTLYAADERFAMYLLTKMSVARTVAYYRGDPFTLDPSTFATNFRAAWSLNVDDVWAAAVGSGAPPSLSPVCPCAADPIAADSMQVSFGHPNAADYRPIAPATSAVTIDFSANGYVNVQSCLRDTPSLEVLQESRGRQSTLVLEPDQGHYFLAFETAGTETFRTSSELSLSPTCAGLSAFAVGSRASQLGLAAPRASRSNWYIGLSTATPTTVQRVDAGTGTLTLCADCNLANCQSLTALAAPVAVSDGAVLQFTPDSSTSTNGLDTTVAIFN